MSRPTRRGQRTPTTSKIVFLLSSSTRSDK
jgi:hypothetical protein